MMQLPALERRLRLNVVVIVLLALAGSGAVFVTETVVSARGLGATRLQERASGKIGHLKAGTLQVSVALRGVVQDPKNQVAHKELVDQTTRLPSEAEDLMALLKADSELKGAIATARLSLRKYQSAIRQVSEAAEKNPDLAREGLAGAYPAAHSELSRSLDTLQESLTRQTRQQMLQMANAEMLGISVWACLSLALIVVGILHLRSVHQDVGQLSADLISTAPDPIQTPAVSTASGSADSNHSADQKGDTAVVASAGGTAPKALPGAVPAGEAGVKPDSDAARSCQSPPVHMDLVGALTCLLKSGNGNVVSSWENEMSLRLHVNLEARDADALRSVLAGTRQAASATASPPPNLGESAVTLRILISEDDSVSRRLLRRILERQPGNEVVETVNGAEAWDLLDKGAQVDLCIADVNMPEISGLQMLQKMRADPRFKSLPVVFYSAVNDPETVSKAGELGAQNYLLKPFSADKVWGEVKAVREKKAKNASGVPPEVAERLGLDAESYATIVSSLTDEIAQTVAEVRHELAKGNRRNAATHVNALKGACLNLGDETLIALTASAENSINSGEMDQVLAELQRLEAESQRLKANAAAARRAAVKS